MSLSNILHLPGLKGKISLRSKSPSVPPSDPKTAAKRNASAPGPQPGHGTNSPPPPTVQKSNYPDLWLEALGKLLSEERKAVETLIPSQRGVHETTQLLDQVKDAVQQQGDKHSEKRWTITFRGQQVVLRDKVQKVLVWVDKFKEIGDAVVIYDPVHMALPWAGFRFLLQATVAEGKQTEALILGLDTMGYLINRCKVYEILYLGGLSKQKSSQAETNLENAAVQLYATILKFFAAATKLYQGRLGYRALQAILNLDKISELIDECQKWATIAHVEADNCERDLSRSARTKSQDAHEELKKLLQELHETFNKTVIVKWVKSEERVQFLRWISDLPFEDVHSVAKNGRTQGTGQWLLNHDALRHWRLDDGPGILWLHGLPGTGKTKLVTTVVDELIQHLDTDEALAYFYCDANRQASVEVLRSFLRQLVSSRKGESIQSSLFDVYMEKKSKGFASSSLDENATRKEFLKLVDSFPQSFIVLDALDECEKDVQAVLVKALKHIINETTRPVKVLISSRPDPYIKNLLGSVVEVEVSEIGNSKDIAKFVTESVHECPEDLEDNEYWSKKMPDTLKEKICEVLIEGSGGMFQWAKLQISQLRRKESERDVRKYLGKLPAQLKDLYNAIWSDIQHEEGDKPVIAQRAFQWLMCTFDLPTPEQLLLIVCQDPDSLNDENDDEAKFPELPFVEFNYVLTACRNLLVIDKIAGVCKFSHLSVQDHFEDVWKSRQSHAFAAKFCLLFLLNPDLSEPASPDSESKEDYRPPRRKRVLGGRSEFSVRRRVDPSKSLRRYADDHWSHHVRAHGDADPDPQLAIFLKQFLGSFEKGSDAFERYMKQRRKKLRPPIFTAASYGLYNILLDWWDRGYPNVNQEHWYEEPLLAVAVDGGSLAIVQWLLRAGADLDPSMGYDKSILLIAVRNKDIKMTKLLLEAGASVEVESLHPAWGRYRSDFGTACLMTAVRNGDLPTLQLLGDSGAKFEYWGEFDRVASHGDEKIMGFFLRHLEIFNNGTSVEARFAIVDKSTALRCALVSAAKHDHPTIVKMLLDFGCDINAVDRFGKTMLSAAASEGNAKRIRHLFDLGADLNPPKSRAEQASSLLYDGIPLTSAVESLIPRSPYRMKVPEQKKRIQEETVELLLSLGADPDRESGGYGNALSGAVHLDNKVIVEHILRASPHAMTREENQILLAIAASLGNLDMVECLLANGAKVNSPGAKLKYKYPADWEHRDGRTVETPLIEAAAKGHLEIARTLVAHGADINARGLIHGNALCAAAREKQEEVVKFLVDCNANVNEQGGEHDETPLMALADSFFFDDSDQEKGQRIAALLLDCRADVNARGGKHGSALAAAEYGFDTELIIELLLSRGAERFEAVRDEADDGESDDAE